MKTVSIIGAGRMGGALAIALTEAGYYVDNLFYCRAPHAELLERKELSNALRRIAEAGPLESDIIILATADAGIGAAAGSIAHLLKKAAVVLHMSGSLSSAVLSAAAENGNATGSMHPLVSISSPTTGAGRFKGAFFCVEGTDTAISSAEALVHSLGGHAFSIDSEFRPLYHAAAVLASGHMTALFQTALETLTACGLERQFASEALLPLVDSTVNNLSERSPEDALTGPFARADIGTIERHLEAFENAGMSRQAIVYLELGSIALGLAEKKGASPDAAEKIRERIKLALAGARC